MPQTLAFGHNDNSIPLGTSTSQEIGRTSEPRLRISVRAPDDTRAELPDGLLAWLHDGMDRNTPEAIGDGRVQERQFETVVVDRLFPIYDTRTFVIRLRDHSRATALAARVVTERAGLDCSDLAYAAGWLHDMGIAERLKQLPPSCDTENAEFDSIWPEIVRRSSAAAVSLATAWRLPSALRHAIREHMSFTTIRPVHELAAGTFIAEHLAGCMGCGFRDEQPTSGLRVALARLRLTERDLIPLGRSAERLLARQAWYWMGTTLPCTGA